MLSERTWAIRLLLAVVAALLAASQALGDSLTCYNQNFQFKPTDWSQALLEEAPARLYLAGAWESTKLTTLTLTVVTHTSYSRWQHLRRQCLSWRGPLVASVYMHLAQAGGAALDARNQAIVEQAKAKMRELHAEMERESAAEQPRACQLTILLFWEVYTHDLNLYPYNTLRNYALLQARTPMVAMVDVDFLLSASLYDELMNPNTGNDIKTQTENGTLYVLPAFETHLLNSTLHQEVELALKAIAAPKAEVAALYKADQLRGAQVHKFPKGHRGTRFDMWAQADYLFPAAFEWQFEPYFIVDRLKNRWFDIRFRGYFYDKSLHSAHLFADGFKFLVHPRLYIVHCPHAPGAALHNQKAKEELFMTLKPKAFGSLLQMVQHQYVPRVDETLLRCLRNIPWWVTDNAASKAGGEQQPFRPHVWFPKKPE